MSYGRHPYGGVGYGGADVAEIPSADTQTALSVEVAFTTGALETPVWEDITADVRFWDVSRGRSRELERFQPGRATVVLGNLSRQYDSVYAAGPHFGDIRPMRRIRIRETFNGVTYPVFDGFIDRWDLDYPAVGKDATATVTATDMFKILARTELPPSVHWKAITDTAPIAWWRLTNNATDDLALDSAGSRDLDYVGSPKSGEALAVNDPATSFLADTFGDTDANRAEEAVTTPVDAYPFTMATLYRSASDLAVNRFLIYIGGNESGGDAQRAVTIYQTSDGQGGGIRAQVTDDQFATSSHETTNTSLDDGKIHHIVVVFRASDDMSIWIDGVDTATTESHVASVDLPSGTVQLALGNTASNHHAGVVFGNTGEMQDFVIWDRTLSDTEIETLYAAATTPWQDDQPDDRLGRVLDEAEWPDLLRELDSGNVALQSAELGTTALEHAQKVGETEYGGLLFVNRAGVVRFVSRETAFGRQPYPVTFGDGAGEVGYRSIRPDDGDEVIRNSVTISRLNGVAQTATGATIDEFGRFQYTLDGLLHRLDSHSAAYAQFIVDEYEDPRRRIVELTVGPPPDGDEALYYPAMLGPELGDAIDVTFTPQGLGDPFEQTCVVEGIRHSSAPGRNRTVTFTLSPEYSFRELEDDDVATIGYAEVTGDQGTFTAATDLTGLTVDVTVGTDRYIKITALVRYESSVADDRATLLIQEGATILQNGSVHLGLANTAYVDMIEVVLEAPSAGAHTYKLVGLRGSGTGNITMDADATRPAFILVEDIGPVPA